MRKFYFQINELIIEIKSNSVKSAYITFGLENFNLIEEGNSINYLGENYLETADNYGLVNDLNFSLDNNILS